MIAVLHKVHHMTTYVYIPFKATKEYIFVCICSISHFLTLVHLVPRTPLVGHPTAVGANHTEHIVEPFAVRDGAAVIVSLYLFSYSAVLASSPSP